jgi:hypothetical protein
MKIIEQNASRVRLNASRRPKLSNNEVVVPQKEER